MTSIKNYIVKRGIMSVLPLAIAAAVTLPLASCGGKNEEEHTVVTVTDTRYRYDHIDKIIGQYTRLIMSTPPEGQKMEELMMDINSRCYMLLQQGDTLTALYFHHAIEDNVRRRDSILADRIFGACPYSAFNLPATPSTTP